MLAINLGDGAVEPADLDLHVSIVGNGPAN